MFLKLGSQVTLILFLLVTGLFRADDTRGQNRLVFPTPDRPVAPIVSSGYSDEKTRDSKGEAERVMDRLGVRPGFRVADIGAGDGYYTVRLARRLGSSATIYAQDVKADYLKRLETRLEREGIRGVRLVLGMPNNPKLMPNSVDVALLSHVYHEIENPYEFFYRLRPALAAAARVAIIDVDRPTQDHGTPPALLRCELEAVGYRQVDFVSLEPAEGYLAIFLPPPELPSVSLIRPCVNKP
jgi:ubiquinone/menaquinone biosynthesis C-methylase UbiE